MLLCSRESPFGRPIIYALKNKLLPWPRNQACTPELLRKGNQEMVSKERAWILKHYKTYSSWSSYNSQTIALTSFSSHTGSCKVFLCWYSFLRAPHSTSESGIPWFLLNSCCQFPAGKEPLPPGITPHGIPPLHLSIWFHFTFLSQGSEGKKKSPKNFKRRMYTKNYPAV